MNTIESADTIRQIIKESVANSIAELLPKYLSTNQKSVFTLDEVIKLLGVSRRHLQHLRDTSQITYSKLGKKIYFTPDDITMFMDNNRISRRTR